MAKKLNLKDFNHADGRVNINIKFAKYNKRFEKAQYALDSQVMTDMVPLMPHNTGTFINVTRAQSAALAGTGEVVAASAPYGRFLYYGKVMVDPETGSPWAREGVKKVLTDKPLTYSNPSAVPEWFEAAKDKHKAEWIKIAQRKVWGL